MTWPNLIWASGQWKIEKKEKKNKKQNYALNVLSVTDRQRMIHELSKG